jgi:hypothetical protein
MLVLIASPEFVNEVRRDEARTADRCDVSRTAKEREDPKLSLAGSGFRVEHHEHTITP